MASPTSKGEGGARLKRGGVLPPPLNETPWTVRLTLCQLSPVVSLFLLHSHSADPPPPLQPPRHLHHLVPGLVDQEEYIQSVLNDIYVYYHCSTNCCMQYQVVQSIIEPHLPVKKHAYRCYTESHTGCTEYDQLGSSDVCQL